MRPAEDADLSADPAQPSAVNHEIGSLPIDEFPIGKRLAALTNRLSSPQPLPLWIEVEVPDRPLEFESEEHFLKRRLASRNKQAAATTLS